MNFRSITSRSRRNCPCGQSHRSRRRSEHPPGGNPTRSSIDSVRSMSLGHRRASRGLARLSFRRRSALPHPRAKTTACNCRCVLCDWCCFGGRCSRPSGTGLLGPRRARKPPSSGARQAWPGHCNWQVWPTEASWPNRSRRRRRQATSGSGELAYFFSWNPLLLDSEFLGRSFRASIRRR